MVHDDEDDHFGMEEEFHAKGERKFSRKERKVASLKDRSKYKKSDQDQLKKRVPEIISSENFMRGRVLSITPDGIVVDAEGKSYLCSLKGSLKQEVTRMKNLIAIGDFVLFLPCDNTGTIQVVEERRSILSRADNLSRRKEQLIAVNIDQVLIATSVVLPPLKPFLVDRYIIAARKGNMEPVIVVNKIDLFAAPPDLVDEITLAEEKELYQEFLSAYTKLGISIYPVSSTTGEGMEALKKAMYGKTSVFSGQSGVGKSSLINAVTGSTLRTGDIVEKTFKGSHTTTAAHLIQLEGGGFCIDTPGIKSFGVWDVDDNEVQSYFPEILAYASECKYPDCRHIEEPECAVQKAVEEHKISHLRFASYCALIASLSEDHRHR